MNSNYDTIINSYLENKVGLSNNFLDSNLSANLKTELLHHFTNNQFHTASIGSKQNEQQVKAIRSDKIFWLDRAHQNKTENLFLDKMDDFIAYLNSTCYTGIAHAEFHYALYEVGSFYGKHKDQFQNNKDRAFSMIHYLNPDWQAVDGGELCIHHAHHQQIIPPQNGTSVFFKSSELEHEVLVSHKMRLSITGWLKTGG
jgi:SM-20-related protein